MASETQVREAFRIQQFYCARMAAPIYARLCGAIGGGLTRESRTGARVLDWQGEPTRDALPLRLVGGLHALVRAGRDAGLAEVFAGTVTGEREIAAAVNAALVAHDDAMLPWLDGPPQTNEPGRSAALMVGLLEIARRHGPRIELLEIGSSAGLNLMIGRYGFDLGGTRIGPTGAPVTLRPEWRGPAPEPADIAIISARGCDVAPLDATDPAVAARLAAYAWPEAAARLARLARAIAMQREEGVRIDRADAADWLRARLGGRQASGVTRVLMHSVVWQYLPPASADGVRSAMAAAAARATAQRPLGWVMMEPDRALAQQVVRARSWPGHGDWGTLATAHAHGAWVNTAITDAERQQRYDLPPSARVEAV